MRHMHGRIVVITGASSGIGRATALRFAKNGDHVVVAARRKNLLQDLVDECGPQGVDALAAETDVSKEKSVEKLARAAEKHFGRIDIWVNDAGVGAAGKFDELKPEEHHRVIETNLDGVINGSWHAIKQFKRQGEGVLINISSVLGKVTQPYMSSYSASKHGVRALGACIRQELWLDDMEDIHVCTVFPQAVDTPFFGHEANRTGYKLKPTPPVETPEHVAEVIFQLADDPRDEVHVGKTGEWISKQQRLARAVTEKEMSMIGRKIIDRGKTERRHAGALWKPKRAERGEIRGGWKDGSAWKRGAALAGVAAPAIGLYLVLKNRQSSQLRQAA